MCYFVYIFCQQDCPITKLVYYEPRTSVKPYKLAQNIMSFHDTLALSINLEFQL